MLTLEYFIPGFLTSFTSRAASIWLAPVITFAF
jgi:hypothetical protein